MAEFTMPSLGADMEQGTLLEWLVHPGDAVHRGDVVAVVDTAKAAVEVEVFRDGVVDRLLVEPGTTVAVGTPLALIGDGAPAAPPEPVPRPEAAREGPPEPAREGPPVQVPRPTPPVDGHVRSPLVRQQAAREGLDLAAVHGSGPGGTVRRHDLVPAAAGRARVSPYARRLAAERGLDLAGVVGSGQDGAVRARDLPDGHPAAPAPAARDDTRMRAAIAALMSRSNTEIPHYYLRTTIDLHAADGWLREHNRGRPVGERLVMAALLLAATARAAVQVPELNSWWVDGRLEPKASVHLGVAVSLRSGGMVTPALLDAQDVPARELMVRLRDLVARARGGRLRASELSEATLTVTNLGERGVEEVLGVIYPPQVALVGFGTVVDRPWAVDGMLAVRPLVTATLAGDHRATDGYVGARLLNRIDQALQRPEEL